MSQGVVWLIEHRRSPAQPGDHPAAAGRMTIGLSLIGAMVSSLFINYVNVALKAPVDFPAVPLRRVA